MAMPAVLEKHGVLIATTAVATAFTGFGVYYYVQRKKEAEYSRKTRKLAQVFDVEDCYVKDVSILFEKLKKFVQGGPSRIQIVTDFDRTLTKGSVDGLIGHSSYGVVEDSSYIPTSAVEKLSSLKQKYFPIEMDTSISEEEKIPLMIEWFTEAFHVAESAGVRKSLLPAMVRESRCCLRDGMEECFHLTKVYNIPFLIISAGVGDIIEEVLRQQSQFPIHAKIVANYYTYNDEGVVDGYKGQLIHTFNKGKISTIEKQYFDKHAKRKNIFLFGDTLGDLAMADGMAGTNNLITIGFLNDRIEESLDAYMSKFDVVLTNDATMDTINVLIRELCRDD